LEYHLQSSLFGIASKQIWEPLIVVEVEKC